MGEDSTGNDAKAAFQREMFSLSASRIRPMRGILLVIATSPRFLVNKLRFPMLRLNRVVAITGISIVQRKVVGKCLSVLPDGGGIKKRVRLRGDSAGTVIHIPANVKHWHGAAADSWFAHLAFEVPGEKTSNEWLEPVTDEEYNKLEQIK